MKHFCFTASGMNFCRSGFNDAFKAWRVSERALRLGDDLLKIDIRRTSVMCYVKAERVYDIDRPILNPARLNYFFAARVTTAGEVCLSEKEQCGLNIAIACRDFIGFINNRKTF